MNVIYAIPGLGTTAALFEKINIPNHRLEVLQWPATQDHFTLQSYALQFLTKIPANDRVKLLGVSFGGMICVELAEKLKAKKTAIISSCKNKDELPMIFKTLGKFGFFHLIGEETLRQIAKRSYRFLGFTKGYRNKFESMINDMPGNYFHHGMKYIFCWDRDKNSIPVLHLHGTRDRVISHRNIRNFTPVAEGTHAMVVNKSGEINRELDKYFNDL